MAAGKRVRGALTSRKDRRRLFVDEGGGRFSREMTSIRNGCLKRRGGVRGLIGPGMKTFLGIARPRVVVEIMIIDLLPASIVWDLGSPCFITLELS